jgi:hypothetical protein
MAADKPLALERNCSTFEVARETPLAPQISDADREAHQAFIATLGDEPIWNDFRGAV